MWDLPLVFVAGLLGSSHCLGMCGPLAIGIGGGAPSWRSNLARQSLFSAGRIFTYTVLGAVAGATGMRVARAFPAILNVPAILSIAAGIWLIRGGLQASGWWPRRPVTSGGPLTGCLARAWFGPLLGGAASHDFLLAGVFTGLLPCGLVYAFCALAAGKQSLVFGAATMAFFGLGTVPLMMLTGCSSVLLHWSTRRTLLRLAAWCVIVAGALSVARGAAFLRFASASVETGCPFCE